MDVIVCLNFRKVYDLIILVFKLRRYAQDVNTANRG